MRNGSDVIVVGAGIVGSSAAYHLAAAGVDATLVEQTHPAGGPSGKSSALLHAFYLMPELSQLAIRGCEILRALPEIAGEGAFVTQVGMMWVCGPESEADWRAAAERIRGENSRIEELTPEAFGEVAPGYDLEGVALALWEPDYGYADAFGATNAIARAARAQGATILQNTPVARLLREGDRVTGVALADGTTLEADTVVLAAGPWTRRLLATVGLDLPLHVERHPMAVLDAAGKARQVMPFAWCDDVSRNYGRPDNEGVILAGTWAGGGTGLRHEEAVRPRIVENPDSYMEGVEEAESVEILETFAARIPAMTELGIRPGYAGLYDMSPDDLPVIGRMPGVDGLVVAAGSSGHGFKTGPAVGEAVMRLVTAGDQPILAPFSPFPLRHGVMAAVAIGAKPGRPFLPAAIRNASVDALVMVAALVVIALTVYLLGGAAMQRVVTYAAIMLTAVLALQIFSGNTGIVSFGHSAFMGLAAYATGILTMPTALQRTALRDLPSFLAGWELPFLAALAVVLVLAVLVGLLTGLPLLRLSGSSASIATLALLIIVYTLLVAGREITRGSQPFYGVPRDVGLWTATAIAAIALVVARLARETYFGLAARAASDDERGAAAVGVDQRTARLAAWVLSVIGAMAAGALMAQYVGAFSPRDFYFDLGFTLLAMLIVGGMTSSLGAFAGVVLTILVIEIVRRFEGGAVILGFQLPVLFGLTQGALALAMILIIWRRPTGLFGKRELDLLRRTAGTAIEPLDRSATAEPGEIVTDHLTRRYAGVVAVEDVSLRFATDMITGIIGPNGAGKTTLLNMIAGDVVPSSGSVSIGVPFRRASAHRFARHGIARTFQNIRIFPRMTVLENVVVAARQVEPDLASAEAVAMHELARMGLADHADKLASALAYGLRRRLEVARALALRPRFLLLDEPAAGMNAVETSELVAILAAVRAERRIGVILIEHDMRLVMNLCQRIVVIDHGRVIADGAPAEVQKNPAVVAAYLGSRTARAHAAPETA